MSGKQRGPGRFGSSAGSAYGGRQNVWPSGANMPDRTEYSPPMDIYERGDGVTVEIELPGVPRENINVFSSGRVITVEGTKVEKNITEAAGGKRVSYIQFERKFGKFTRDIELPVPCDTTKAKARYQKGILTIEVPKIEDRRGRKIRIEVE